VTLQRMLGAISHRGPDQFGGFIDGGTALGCARLSIVDLEGGTQPAVSREHRIAVVFNGEIFNYLTCAHSSRWPSGPVPRSRRCCIST
jgi:asparagine synthase (glutamine-hydrolysing)